MWLRHALKLLTFFIVFSACSPQDRQAADKLNALSYAYHYRDLDSTEHYAREAIKASADYKDGRAEALNNLAFVCITRMQYDQAKTLLDSVYDLTDNQLELLVADVQQMRLCQRRSRNREFYDYRTMAQNALHRIDEERDKLNARQTKRLLYAESEMAIVTSTYYYYVGLEQLSVDALLSMNADLKSDTAQWLNYLYNVGAGGIIIEGSSQEIRQQEFDYLLQCHRIADQFGSPYFLANSLEGMAEHLIDADDWRPLVIINPSDDALFKMFSQYVDDDLPVSLAKEALRQFIAFGDTYQISGAYRTLASCYRTQGDFPTALRYLNEALSDSSINQAPDLVASIHEQLSVAYSAMNDKKQSDFNRNIYLDLQEQTRQDRSLEARAGQLDATVAQLNKLLAAVVLAILLLAIVLRVMYVVYLRRRPRQAAIDELHEQREQLEEQWAIGQMKLKEAERRNIEQRSKVSLVNSITPFIDRMLHEVRRIQPIEVSADTKSVLSERDEERLEYVKDLAAEINEVNAVLTHWIQLRQGEFNLHIETFPIEQLFTIIAKGKRSFALRGIELNVESTGLCVKADRVLTLFMLNTLADNARKFTESGGKVIISATELADSIEISVADTGRGMTEDELAHVFDHKIAGGHGFGLQNCRGIIEKYRKTSQIFNVCKIAAESRIGEGSRFYFRLPKGTVRQSSVSARLLPLLLLFATTGAAQSLPDSFSAPEPSPRAVPTSEELLHQASNYADSAYYSNIDGTFEKTLIFADSCFHCLNQYFRRVHPKSVDTLSVFDQGSSTIPDIFWLHNSVKMNYNILLVARNESAVAALALHEWALYNYNNRIYTLLFKELSADQTLDDYCKKMQQSQTNRSVAIIMLVLILLILLVAILFQVVLLLSRKAARILEQQAELEVLNDDIRRVEVEEARLHVSNQVLDNCLSSLKHETMYYPSRIRQLVDTGNIAALPEVVGYYRELYGILSEQANRQVETVKLHLTKLEHEILGDRVLIDYLFELLRREAHQKTLDISYNVRPDAPEYVTCRVPMPGVTPASFMPSTDNLNYLLCRQIVREHGEATSRHACGISTEQTANGSFVIITLPRYKTTNSTQQ